MVPICPLELTVWGQTGGFKGKDFPRTCFFKGSGTGQKMLTNKLTCGFTTQGGGCHSFHGPLLNSIQLFRHGIP